MAARQPSLSAKLTPSGLTANVRVPFNGSVLLGLAQFRPLVAGAAAGAFLMFHSRPEGEGFAREIPVSIAKMHGAVYRVVLPWVETNVVDRVRAFGAEEQGRNERRGPSTGIRGGGAG